MTRRTHAISLTVIATLLAATGCDHSEKQYDFLQRAQSQYYDLLSAGVKEYHCDVHLDWDALLTSLKEKPQDDSPWLQYLRQSHLTFSAPLQTWVGGPTVEWVDPFPPPAGKQDQAKFAQDTSRSLVMTFLTVWKSSLNGTEFPSLPSPDIKITPKSDGYTLTLHSTQDSITEWTMDKSMRITHTSIHGPKVSGEMDEKYMQSPKGLLLIEFDYLTPNPAALHVIRTMRTAYANVGDAQVPASLSIDMYDGAQVRMQFSHCGVMD